MDPKRTLIIQSKFSPSKISPSQRASGIPAFILLGLFLAVVSSISAFPQSASAQKDASANELLRKAVDSELKGQSNDHSHWMYQLTANDPGKKQVKWIVETREGDLTRLSSVNGRPITAEEQKQEDERIQNLVQKPAERKKQQRA